MADAILAGDWQWKGYPSVALEPPLDWDGLCARGRSWSLALHSWEPLAVALAAYDNLGERRYLDFALALALDWLDRFPSPDGGSSPFAWYDMAVGARTYRLAYLLDAIARDPERDGDVISLLLAGLRLHAASLADERHFASHSNHGFYQVLGQLAMARRFPDLPEIAAAGKQGRDRLAAILHSHFTAEGVHREHSPQYHRLVLIPLRALQKAELIDDPDMEAFCKRIEEALAWFITPARRFAMFGDTDRERIVGSFANRYASAPLVFSASGGGEGEPPSASTRGFPESGYVVFRDRWPSGEHDFADCSYLAQTCAFHSRVHKHADDLSFVWYDRGQDILTDAGRFGYAGRTTPDSELYAEGFWYSDPRRIYVESTRSHNTVEVDGRSNPRRGVQPYGSALTQWGEVGELRFSEARVERDHLSHARVLLFWPGRWLLVIDHLADSRRQSHDFAQRFHLAPELELTFEQGREGDAIAAVLPSGDRLHAMALVPQTPIDPVRGATQPRRLGWMSPRDGEMIPQWSFGWAAAAVPSHIFASLFCFASEPPRVARAGNRVSSDASVAELGWDVDGSRYALAFERFPGRSFEVEALVDDQVVVSGGSRGDGAR
jgi:hypothetical protein